MQCFFKFENISRSAYSAADIVFLKGKHEARNIADLDILYL